MAARMSRANDVFVFERCLFFFFVFCTKFRLTVMQRDFVNQHKKKKKHLIWIIESIRGITGFFFSPNNCVPKFNVVNLVVVT